MKSISFFAIVALLASALLSAFFAPHNIYTVVGGEYELKNGETLNSDLYALFADVKLEKGSRVNGSIFSLCSNVYKDGAVEGNSKSYQFLGFNILIPELTRLRIKY